MMDRRSFLKKVAAASAGAIVGPAIFRIIPEAVAAEAVKPIVAFSIGKDYEALVASVLKPLGGIEAFVKKGQSVLVKPNIGWDKNTAQAANTHPLVVKALVKLALNAGASKVMVFDRPCNPATRTYVTSGILPAVQAMNEKNVELIFMDDRKYVPLKIERGKSLTEWKFYKDALDADVYINVPIAKVHGGSGLTLGLKNVMGVIGGDRGVIHQSLAQRCVDLNTVIRPKLTVIDATRMLMKHGPQGGNLEDVKIADTLVASADIVAADAYATTLFDKKPESIEMTRLASEMGLGEMDLNRVKVEKV